MKRVLLTLLLWLAPGAPAWAASALDAPRAEAGQARARVRELRESQQALRGELNTLAGRIEQLKAEQRGRLAAAPELDKALRRSQELSGQLTGLAQALAGAESEAERRHLALHTLLSDELARVRAAWDATTDRQARAGLLERMRTLRTEPALIHSRLPSAGVSVVRCNLRHRDPEFAGERGHSLPGHLVDAHAPAEHLRPFQREAFDDVIFRDRPATVDVLDPARR